jgi:opacity protein-like surface antigen
MRRGWALKMKKHLPNLAALLIVASAFCTPAIAQEPLGLYLGAAAGSADVRADAHFADTLNDISRTATGWKAMVGIRPLPIVGAEFEYVDFGDSNYRQSDSVPTTTTGNVRSRAETLFGLLYAPIPVPFLDVFAKAGAARLQTKLHGFLSPVFCPNSTVDPGCPFFSGSASTTDFAYGAGVQLKFSALALRAEYERINSGLGAPDLLSLGVTWTF